MGNTLRPSSGALPYRLSISCISGVTVKELIVKPTFRELHKRYCEIKANPMTFDLQTIDIEHEYPILGRAYRQLGVKELKRLRTIKSIQEALGEA